MWSCAPSAQTCTSRWVIPSRILSPVSRTILYPSSWQHPASCSACNACSAAPVAERPVWGRPLSLRLWDSHTHTHSPTTRSRETGVGRLLPSNFPASRGSPSALPHSAFSCANSGTGGQGKNTRQPLRFTHHLGLPAASASGDAGLSARRAVRCAQLLLGPSEPAPRL